jgi:hypothetical protein
MHSYSTSRACFRKKGTAFGLQFVNDMIYISLIVVCSWAARPGPFFFWGGDRAARRRDPVLPPWRVNERRLGRRGQFFFPFFACVDEARGHETRVSFFSCVDGGQLATSDEAMYMFSCVDRGSPALLLLLLPRGHQRARCAAATKRRGRAGAPPGAGGHGHGVLRFALALATPRAT